MARNVKINIQGNELIITVDLNQNFGPSASGKSTIVASSQGYMQVPGEEGIGVNLNIIKSFNKR